MKKIQKLGKVLSKAEQRQINGAVFTSPCDPGQGYSINKTQQECNYDHLLWFNNACWICYL